MEDNKLNPLKETVIFSVDQKPYQVIKQRFCVLYPLMTLKGKKVDDVEEIFPNRGRVHWMIRENIPDSQVVEGALWIGRVEAAPQYSPTVQKKDMYQAMPHAIRPVTDEIVEVIDLDEVNPDISIVREHKPIPWARPTAAAVFLRGPDKVMGPLGASWSKQSLTLSPLPNSEETFIISLQDFQRMIPVREFIHETNRWELYGAPSTLMKISLVIREQIKYDELRAEAEVVNVTPDERIISWAAKMAGLSRQELRKLTDSYRAISEVAEGQDESKSRRLKEIADRTQRVALMSEETARVLAGCGLFEQLIKAHIDAITKQEVEREISVRRKSIEEQMQSLERSRKNLMNDFGRLEQGYATKVKKQEEDLAEQQKKCMDSLVKKEAQISERESVLAKREKELSERLERVTRRYHDESQKLGDDLLAQLPLLGRFAWQHGDAEEKEQRPAELPIPAFLQETRKRHHPAILEPEFIEQFAGVVERRGFRFEKEDLINFHVCVKTGFLTILAGRSGTGKSSLPRLYAEALDCCQEYLTVPVRPDWLDDRDLIGAYNSLARRFEPSNSCMVDRLIAAHVDSHKQRGGMYIICLDEMNLARVEHYFAQFLSVLENPRDARCISLFAEGIADATEPYLRHRIIPIGGNIRFIGTVNIDQTTHFFSPKVLDRAQVVSFSAPDLRARRHAAVAGSLGGIVPVVSEVYAGWVRESRETDACRDTLLRANEILCQSRLELSYRQYERILRYVSSAAPMFSSDKALDFQFLQVVLPRLRRTAPAFDATLSKLRQIITSDRFARSSQMLERIAEAEPEDEFFQLL